MTSPFKFLDPYGVDDSKTFFGRDAEVEALYTLVVQSRLVLVYGPSGSGKTSLIQCGLANRFRSTDWFPVFVRRKDDINASLDAEIRALVRTPIKDGAGIVDATASLYRDYYRPLYFIFDQFEELFIFGTPGEEAKFFARIEALLASDLNCKIIISMREEYIAMLQSFEQVVPTLFASRLRIEQMTLGTVEDVIIGMTAAAGITLENGPETARRIIAQIGDRRAGVQLAYLQVYLDTLYRHAEKSPTPLLFTDALVDRTGALGDVMADFLEQQLAAIETRVRSRHPKLPAGSVQRVLETLTTAEGTKQPIAAGELAQRLPDLQPMLGDILGALDSSRIIRRSGDIVEVSHDQLARRIAERCSSDRKALMRIEKLIKDRLAGHDAKTTNWLTAEQLVLARPVLGQLQLSAEEAAFVKASGDRARRQRLALIGGTAAVIAVLAGFGLWAGIERSRAFDAISVASTTTNTLASTIVDRLRGMSNTEDVRRELLAQVRQLNAELSSLDDTATGDAGFWVEIMEGDIGQDTDARDEARAKFASAVGMAERQLARLPDDPLWLRNLSIALGRLAAIETLDGRPDAAAALYRRSVEISEKIAQATPDDAFVQHDLEIRYGDMAIFEREAGRLPAARAYIGKALVIAGNLERIDSANSDWRRDHAYYLSELGKIEQATPAYDRARTAFAASAARYIANADAEPTRDDRRTDVIWGHYNWAELERLAGRWPEAIDQSDKALAAVVLLGGDQQAGMRKMLDDQRALIEARERRPPAT